jgi:hypothetical protein
MFEPAFQIISVGLSYRVGQTPDAFYSSFISSRKGASARRSAGGFDITGFERIRLAYEVR